MKKATKISLYTLLTVIIVAGIGVFLFLGFEDNSEKVTVISRDSQNSVLKNTSKENNNVLFATNGIDSVYKKQNEDGKWVVILDGQDGNPYNNVYEPTFSPDGSQFAYAAEKDDGTLVVINNTEEIYAYDGVSAIVFSPDGSRIAIVADKKEKEIVILDGEESGEYDEVGTLTNWDGESSKIIFSPDSQSISYKVVEDGKEYIVTDGVDGKKYDEIGKFEYSDDSSQVAYEAEIDGQEIIVIDNEEQSSNNDDSNDNDNNSGGNMPPNIGIQHPTYSDSVPGVNDYNSENFNRENPKYMECEKGDERCNF